MPIFDQGYQHWNGRLSGHARRWLAVTRQGVRAQMRNRWTRLVLLVAWVPAIALGTVLALWGLIEQRSEVVTPLLQVLSLPPELSTNPTDYRLAVWTIAFHYFFVVEIYLAMILVLLVGPGLISQDLRFNAIPLYLSRPLTRADYFLGKLGVIATCLGAVVIVPPVVAYLLGVLFSLDFGVIRDTFPLLLGSIALGVVIVLSAGLLMLALSSLSRSSRYVAAFWVGAWFISGWTAVALEAIHLEGARRNLFRTQRELHQMTRERERGRGAFPFFPPRDDPKDRERRDELRRRLVAAEEEYAEAVRNNWRPMISFTGNLRRLETALLGTNAAWDRFATIASLGDDGREPGGRPRPEPEVITQEKGPQYPWYWSAGVLAALMGISVWIMTARVRSLDRLK